MQNIIRNDLAQIFPELFHPIYSRNLQYEYEKIGDAELNVAEALRSSRCWERYIQNNDEIVERSKKKVLLTGITFYCSTTHEFESRIQLIYSLINASHELYILNKAGKLVHIDPLKVGDMAYLKSLFAQSQCLHNPMQEGDPDPSKILLENNHESPDDYCVLDHYGMQKLSHCIASSPSSELEFQYSLSITSNEWEKHLDFFPLFDTYDFKKLPTYLKELDLTFYRKTEEFPDFSKYRLLKKLILPPHFKMTDFEKLPPNIEELDCSKCEGMKELPDFSKHKSLKKLIPPSDILEIDFQKLPPYLEELRLSWCNKLKELPDLSGCKFLKKLIPSSNTQAIDSQKLPPHLEELTLYLCIRIENPLDLFHCTFLKKLTLPLQKSTIVLSRLPLSLEVLDCQAITVEGSIDFSKCTSLKELALSITTPDIILPPKLEKLSLWSNTRYITLPDLSKYTYLKELDCGYKIRTPEPAKLPLRLEKLSLDALPDLSKCTFLKELTLSSGMQTIEPTLLPPGLEVLDIGRFSPIGLLPDLSKYVSKKLILPGSVFSKTYSSSAEDLSPPSLPVILEHKSSALDTDTYTPPNTTCSTSYYIYKTGDPTPLDPGIYREQIAQSVKLENENPILYEKEGDEFQYVSEEHLSIQRVSGFQKEELETTQENTYFCQFPVTPFKRWTPLSGLSPSDRITKINLPSNAKIRYNKRTQQYQIYCETLLPELSVQYLFISKPGVEPFPIQAPELPLLPESLKVEIKNLFENPPPDQSVPAFQTLQQKVNAITYLGAKEKLEFCLGPLQDYFGIDNDGRENFKNAPLTPVPGLSTFSQILTQAKGSCRHRAFVYTLICQYLGVPTRQTETPVHCYAEIWDRTHWKKINLGGAEAGLISTAMPLQLAESPPTAFALGLRGYYSPQIEQAEYKTDKDVLQDLNQKKNIFLKVSSLEDGRSLHAALSAQLKQEDTNHPIIYLECMDDVHNLWTYSTVLPNGQRESKKGALQTLLQSGRGTLVINWGRFNATEMSSCMGVMEEPNPTFLGVPVSSNLKQVHLIPPNVVAGNRFYSRAREFIWPASIPKPQPHIPFSTTGSAVQNKDTKQEKESKKEQLDLYGNPLTHRPLLQGEIRLQGNRFEFVEGALIKAIRSGETHLELIDAPWQDAGFSEWIHRLSIERQFVSNGEVITLPEGFMIHKGPEAPQLVPPENTAFPLSSQTDIFYLNRHTLKLLFRQPHLTKEGLMETLPGWLKRKPALGQHKTLVLTQPLSPDQKRQVYDALSSADYANVKWVDLTQPVDTTLAYSLPDGKTETLLEEKPESCAQLIEAYDPAFTASTLEQIHPGALVLPLNIHTRSNEYVEKVTLDSVDKTDASKWHFEHARLALTKALLEGQTVILSGQLSEEFYYTVLEPLFNSSPTLRLSDSAEPVPVKGKLLIVSQPLSFKPRLAQYKKGFSQNTEIPWKDYETQLKKDYPNEKESDLIDQIRKIYWFYISATQIPHGQTGTPPKPRISYTRIKRFIEASKEPQNDNPIKPFFHHDYQHDTEIYARLNILAKLYFGTDKAKENIRFTKLSQYPIGDPAYFWRRLNCLNAQTLRRYFNTGFPQDKIINQETLEKFETWLSENQDQILQQKEANTLKPDPQIKTNIQLQKILKTQRTAVLKGPPGSGKTFAAFQYVQAVKGEKFFGEKQITQWLQAEPDTEAVLILDEANLSQPGVWEFLTPLLQATPEEKVKVFWNQEVRTISAKHKIIFTGNPEHFPARFYHNALQDSATLYVKSWTPESLKKYIVQPLCKKIDPQSLNSLNPLMDQLIQIYEKANALLQPADMLSVRDLQQVVTRWMNRSKKENMITAVYKACELEWGQRFPTLHKQNQFIKVLKDSLNIPSLENEIKSEPTPSIFSNVQAITHQISKDYYLTEKHKLWINILHEDMHLAETYATLKNPLDDTPIVKQGVLLEGYSGIGKTTLFLKFLEASGYIPLSAEDLLIDKNLLNLEGNHSKYYLQFAPTGDFKRDEAILRKAFLQGYKVILDELNLDPLLENLLNQLMTGKTPEGELPQKSGFFVLASQNDAKNQPGSKNTSIALKNRFHVVYPILTEVDLKKTAVTALRSVLRNQDETTINTLAQNHVLAYSMMQKAYPDKVNLRRFFQGLKEYCCKIGASHSFEEEQLEQLRNPEKNTLQKDEKKPVPLSRNTFGNPDNFFPKEKRVENTPVSLSLPQNKDGEKKSFG